MIVSHANIRIHLFCRDEVHIFSHKNGGFIVQTERFLTKFFGSPSVYGLPQWISIGSMCSIRKPKRMNCFKISKYWIRTALENLKISRSIWPSLMCFSQVIGSKCPNLLCMCRRCSKYISICICSCCAIVWPFLIGYFLELLVAHRSKKFDIATSHTIGETCFISRKGGGGVIKHTL